MDMTTNSTELLVLGLTFNLKVYSITNDFLLTYSIGLCHGPLLCLCSFQDTLLTGSYDKTIAVIDIYYFLVMEKSLINLIYIQGFY